MKLFLEVILITTTIALADAKSQDIASVSHCYVYERGTMVTLLFFENEKIYYLSYHKPGQLGFCIETSYSFKGDTLQTENLGNYLIKKKKLLVINKNEISKGSDYKSVKTIEKFINCLRPYGIYLDSSQLVVPRHLISISD